MLLKREFVAESLDKSESNIALFVLRDRAVEDINSNLPDASRIINIVEYSGMREEYDRSIRWIKLVVYYHD